MKAVVVDSSAWLAIAHQEPESNAFSRLLLQSEQVLVAAPIRLEIALVCWSRGSQMLKLIDDLYEVYGAQFIAFDNEMAQIAVQAFERFGKGRHKAGLNYGDCMSYACAKSRNIPLLYKGQDFLHTDLQNAISL